MRSKSDKRRLNKKIRVAIIIAVLLLAAGIAAAGVARYSLSLNSPAAFPVDI